MEINFAELRRQYNKYQNEYEEAALRVLRSGWYILGKEAEQFEHDYAAFQGVKHCIGVGNGLDALKLALTALHIGAGDEVLVPANTFIATALAVTANGATPIFVDVDAYFGIDVQAIEKAITKKTKAIIAVHLYGQMCDMASIIQIAEAHKLFVVEDCAQAHGAVYQGKKAGTFGDVACFSFYPMKPIGAFGDAGAVVTDSDAIAEEVRMLRNYGSKIKYQHEFVGVNSRMDELQAAILGVNLKYAQSGNRERQSIAQKYLNGIHNPAVTLPQMRNGCEHVYHVFPLLCDARDRLQNYLAEHGIHTQIHYPVPCHLAKCYETLGYQAGDLPFAEQFASTELSLPIYIGLTDAEIQYIIETINAFV